MGNGLEVSLQGKAGYLNAAGGNSPEYCAGISLNRSYNNGNFWKAEANVGNVVDISGTFGHTFGVGKSSNVDVYVKGQTTVAFKGGNVGCQVGGQSTSTNVPLAVNTVSVGSEYKVKSKAGTFGFGARAGYDTSGYDVTFMAKDLATNTVVEQKTLSKNAGWFATPTVTYESPKMANKWQVKVDLNTKNPQATLSYTLSDGNKHKHISAQNY